MLTTRTIYPDEGCASPLAITQTMRGTLWDDTLSHPTQTTTGDSLETFVGSITFTAPGSRPVTYHGDYEEHLISGPTPGSDSYILVGAGPAVGSVVGGGLDWVVGQANVGFLSAGLSGHSRSICKALGLPDFPNTFVITPS